MVKEVSDTRSVVYGAGCREAPATRLGCRSGDDIPLDRSVRDDPQYATSVTLNAAPKSDCTLELTGLVMMALGRIFRPGYLIRKAGVTLAGLEPAQRLTRRLWDDVGYERRRALMVAMDTLNQRFGRQTVGFGLYPEEGVWRTKAERVSPRFTTRWDENAGAV